MEFSSRKILEILRKKGVTNLYHSNTVRTSCSFLSQGKLLARGSIEKLGSLLEHDWRTYSGLLLGSGWPGKSFADYAARFLNCCP